MSGIVLTEVAQDAEDDVAMMLEFDSTRCACGQYVGEHMTSYEGRYGEETAPRWFIHGVFA